MSFLDKSVDCQIVDLSSSPALSVSVRVNEKTLNSKNCRQAVMITEKPFRTFDLEAVGKRGPECHTDLRLSHAGLRRLRPV